MLLLVFCHVNEMIHDFFGFQEPFQDLGAPNQAVQGILARLTDLAKGSCQILVVIFPQL